MQLKEAYDTLDLDYQHHDLNTISLQYRWLVKFYHPDNPKTGDAKALQKVIEAYQTLRDFYSFQ